MEIAIAHTHDPTKMFSAPLFLRGVRTGTRYFELSQYTQFNRNEERMQRMQIE